MESIVIYDSNCGNTQTIAETITKETGGQVYSVNDFRQSDLTNVDLLIVGSPINAWGPSPKIKNFVSSLVSFSLLNVKAAAFDTRVKFFISGNAAKKISRNLEEKGATIVAEPKGFYVIESKGPLAEGEI